MADSAPVRSFEDLTAFIKRIRKCNQAFVLLTSDF